MRARDAVGGKPGTRGLKEVSFLPVIPDPHVTWALALNFKRHIDETGLTTSREFPHLFIRTPMSLVGPPSGARAWMCTTEAPAL